jgi:hypothetical protein
MEQILYGREFAIRSIKAVWEFNFYRRRAICPLKVHLHRAVIVYGLRELGYAKNCVISGNIGSMPIGIINGVRIGGHRCLVVLSTSDERNKNDKKEAGKECLWFHIEEGLWTLKLGNAKNR